jgi:hypothetical protein
MRESLTDYATTKFSRKTLYIGNIRVTLHKPLPTSDNLKQAFQIFSIEPIVILEFKHHALMVYTILKVKMHALVSTLCFIQRS